MTQISTYLTLVEATASNTAKKLGISNQPDATQLLNMKNLATKIFDPVREFVGGKLAASSFLRVPAVNRSKNVGGSQTSDHETGEAIDITTKWYKVDKTNSDVFHYIKDNLLFDQLIWEFGDDNEPDWVHVGLRRTRPNRKMILIAYRDNNGKVKYKKY